MKKSPVSLLLLLLLALSCKKASLINPTAANTPIITAVSKGDTTKGWIALNQWSKKTFGAQTLFLLKRSDSSITAPIVEKGLVLAYRKTDTLVRTLPFHENQEGHSFHWFYQVRDSALQVGCQVSGAGIAAPAAGGQLTYLVITPEQLSKLEAKGYTRVSLMQLPYASTTKLFHSVQQ